MRSRAFAFLKPHAMASQAVVTAVGDRFEEAGVAVSWRGPHPATGLAELYDRHVGPVGLEGLTTYKWILRGAGQTVAPFVSGEARFTHRPLPLDPAPERPADA